MAERDAHGRFVPGVSGNPGGRATDARVAIGRARELSPDAVEELWRLAIDKKVSAATRKDCLIAILDRGLGRPRQTVHLDAAGLTRSEEMLEELSDEELRAIIQAPRAALPATLYDAP